MCILGIQAFSFAEIFSNIVTRWYYYVFLFVAIALVVIYAVFGKKSETLKLSETKKLTYLAILTALCTLANILCFYVYLPARCAVSFIAIPCFIAGYLLGAKEGFIVGFLGDLLGVLIMPQGAYLPIIGVASGLFGFIPGIVFNNFKGNNYVKLAISFGLCFIICSAFLNTLANWLYVALENNSKTTFWAYLIARVWFQAIVTVANAIICGTLIFTLDTIKKVRVKGK